MSENNSKVGSSEKPENSERTIKVGSRKSELALIQTKHVISLLQKLFPNAKYEIYKMTTVGDRVLNKSLPKIGEKSLFTKDLEDALRTGGVDFVVHSLKDLPTQLPNGMTIGAVLEREDPRDALVLNKKFLGKNLKTLPEGSMIGTSSLRRTAQIFRNYKNLNVCDIRGNLNTRLAKLDDADSKFSGIILANAGLGRMGWNHRVDQVIEPSELYYAVGQGALAVECRVNDPFTLDMLSQLCDLKTQCRILAERSFLKTLGGGCSAPVAVRTDFKKNEKSQTRLDIRGGVWSLNGDTEIIKDAAEILDFDDDDLDEEERPRKKIKLDESATNVNIVEETCPGKSGTCEKGKIDSTHLVDMHGKMFAKCPYSGKTFEVTEEEKKKLLEGNKLDISAKLPIGQDFMGDCPMLNTNEIVKFQETQTKSETDECPFVMIDYETENDAAKCEGVSIIDEKDCDVKLYCGLFARDDKIKALFEKSESLGICLANKLIAEGALDVMTKAQNEIHSKA